MIISVFDRVENIMEKGKIACSSYFSISHNVFKRLLSQTRQKVSLCGKGLRTFRRQCRSRSSCTERAASSWVYTVCNNRNIVYALYRVLSVSTHLTHYHTMPHFDALKIFTSSLNHNSVLTTNYMFSRKSALKFLRLVILSNIVRFFIRVVSFDSF